MTKTFAVAALTLICGCSVVQAAEQAPGGYIQLAQMNSPCDGLDRNAASEGNGRPRAYQGTKTKRSTIVQPRRKRAR